MKSRRSQASIEVQIFGDVSLNGLYGNPQNLNELRDSLIQLSEKVGTPALRIINWEAPITRAFKFNQLKNPVIATTEVSAKLFCDTFPFDIACLGNNHIGDCLDEGFETTTQFFKRKGIETVGAGTSIKAAEALLIKNIENCKIGVLSFTGEETNPKIHPDSTIYINSMNNLDRVYELISDNASKVDFLLVNLHWGIEFMQYPKQIQKDIAHKCIESGASIIIGHHSHCLQGVEEYKNGLVFYSLGNFIFSGLKGKETVGWPKFCNRGGGYKVFLSKDKKFEYDFLPFTVSNSGVDVINGIIENKKKQKKLGKRLLANGRKYQLCYALNFVQNWMIRIPLFLIKTKGGLFKALVNYANPQYIKLVFSYFSK